VQTQAAPERGARCILRDFAAAEYCTIMKIILSCEELIPTHCCRG